MNAYIIEHTELSTLCATSSSFTQVFLHTSVMDVEVATSSSPLRAASLFSPKLSKNNIIPT